MRSSTLGALVVVTGLFGLASPAAAQRQESYRVVGLEAPAEILVDRWGVPHLYAASFDDVFFLQGWNAARDRLWQLDLWKRRGEGRLAEVFGPSFVEQDRAARLLLYRGDMYAEWLAYASDTKRIVSAFVAGVNAFIELTDQQPELLPFEFRALEYPPLRWTPETVVRIRSHGLLRNVSSEVRRARTLRDLGLERGRRALFYRDRLEPERPLEIPDGLALEDVPDEVLDVYELGTRRVTFPEDLLTTLGLAPPGGAAARASMPIADPAQLTPEQRREVIGSNNWAVAASRTATGRPLLADDPHRSLSLPSLRYLVHLAAPGVDVVGAGEPALPGVSIGHNGTMAFGLTIFGIDQEDLYVYETRPEDPLDVRYRGRWEPMTVVRERIDVRGGEPVEVELRFTRHGPVLHEDFDRRRAHALRAAWLEPGMAPYLGSIELMRARDWDEFLAAMNRWGAPSENQVYADTSGNIGWKPGGRSPRRVGWDGLLPVPGDGRYEWAGYRDMDELPVESNPARGWVATANQMNLPPGFSDPTGYEWAAPFRHQRIAEVLETTPALTVEQAVALQTDFLSVPARRLVALIEGISAPEGSSAARALALLQGWDGVLSAGSGAAALFEIWFRRFLGETLLERVELDEAVREAVGRPDSAILLDVLEGKLAVPSHVPDSWARLDRSLVETVVADSLELAWEESVALLGEDARRWSWGELHRVALSHPLAHLSTAPDGGSLEVGPLPRGGSGDTVGNTSYRTDTFRQRSGASFRMVVDVGAWDRSVAMSSPGQSGDPASPHWDDLFPEWAADRAFPLLYSRDRIEAETTLRIELEPASADSSAESSSAGR
ncbi:MAG TPA: penicillin acylase family protein [Thermoanaerobaculia bacterium]|nr:penicillin acylase family protein [Thermoanaerobaculia bacterium]